MWPTSLKLPLNRRRKWILYTKQTNAIFPSHFTHSFQHLRFSCLTFNDVIFFCNDLMALEPSGRWKLALFHIFFWQYSGNLDQNLANVNPREGRDPSLTEWLFWSLLITRQLSRNWMCCITTWKCFAVCTLQDFLWFFFVCCQCENENKSIYYIVF